MYDRHPWEEGRGKDISMKVNVYVASAFSKDDMGGNRAGVVLGETKLNKAEKTAIAYQLGYSETAFVLKSGKADFKLEYFTPTGEVPLCGHATVGTFAVLRHLHRLDKPCHTIETKSGILRVTDSGDGLILMEQNAPRFYETLNKDDLQRCFPTDILAHDMPIQIVSTGLKDILVPVSSPEALERMIPDFAAVSRLSREKDCVGVHAFSLVREAREGGINRGMQEFCPPLWTKGGIGNRYIQLRPGLLPVPVRFEAAGLCV